MEPITAAIAAATSAALSVGSNLVQMKYSANLKRELKKQRNELYFIEAVTVLGAGASLVNDFITRKKYTSVQSMMEVRINAMENALPAISEKIDVTNQLLNKLDMISQKVDKLDEEKTAPKDNVEET